MEQYVPLCHDLTRLMKQAEGGNNLSCAQQEHYLRRRGRERGRIERTQFGRYDKLKNPEPLCLLSVDGWDDEPIGSMSPSEVQDFWDLRGNHIVPPLRDIVRIAAFFNQDFYAAVHLGLKSEWERWFSREMGHRMAYSDEGGKILFDGGEVDVQGLLLKPDTQTLFELLEEHGGQASRAGYDSRAFDALVHDMIMHQLHWSANDSKSLADFSACMREERQEVTAGTPEEQEKFWIAKCIFAEKKEEHAQHLVLMEDRRKENSNIFLRYLKIFGAEDTLLREHIDRCKLLEMKVFHKENEPGLSSEEVEQRVAEDAEKFYREQEEMRGEFRLAQTMEPMEGGVPVDAETMSAMERTRKKVLANLWMLLHPDRLHQHLDYSKLTQVQKDYLDELWHRVMTLRDEDRCADPRAWEYNHVTVQRLQGALVEAQTILANAGIEVRVNLIPQGKTLGEKLEWLEKAIFRLEEEILDLKAQLNALRQNPRIREIQALLKRPEQHEKIREEMRAKAEEYRLTGDELEARLGALFQEETAR